MVLERKSPPGVLMVITGECQEPAAMPASLDDLRQKLETKGEVRRCVRTHLRDGSEAIDSEVVSEIQGLSASMLVVPNGKTALVMVYMVPNLEGDPIGWGTIRSGIKHNPSGIPMWVWAAGGGLVLLLILLKLASGGTKPDLGSVNFQKGAFGDTPTWGGGASAPAGQPGTQSRPAFGGGDASPASRPMGAPAAPASRPMGAPPATAPGAPQGAPGAGVYSPPARAPEPTPQLPGLRSTLPPSGEWSKR